MPVEEKALLLLCPPLDLEVVLLLDAALVEFAVNSLLLSIPAARYMRRDAELYGVSGPTAASNRNLTTDCHGIALRAFSLYLALLCCILTQGVSTKQVPGVAVVNKIPEALLLPGLQHGPARVPG
ncbi:hypothetical protein IW262DRAFT_1297919 [Armillaria fumosa]|nr:hypothetical protein IW262DRAFT_1297919 [Armillaria fumosa]